jgi:hypothetical protein
MLSILGISVSLFVRCWCLCCLSQLGGWSSTNRKERGPRAQSTLSPCCAFVQSRPQSTLVVSTVSSKSLLCFGFLTTVHGVRLSHLCSGPRGQSHTTGLPPLSSVPPELPDPTKLSNFSVTQFPHFCEDSIPAS